MAKTLIETLNDIAASLPPEAVVNLPPRDAVGLWMEEALLVYCVGQGTFSQDMTTINLMMDMFDFKGRWIGYQQGVHLSHSTPQDLFSIIPPPPYEPFDVPSPVPTGPVKEWTKGLWTFADGSGIYAVGPAQSHIIPFKDGSNLFMVTTGQVLAGGTGRYAGCAGIKSATGTALIPPGLLQSGKFPAPGLQFEARTIENFRIALKEYVVPQPTGGPPASRAAARRRAAPTRAARARAAREQAARARTARESRRRRKAGRPSVSPPPAGGPPEGAR